MADTEKDLVKDLMAGREIALRLETTKGTLINMVFSLRDAKRALVPVIEECPL